jgi:hypothetical protein
LLARAKKTIAKGYALVGLTAEMKTNFAVRTEEKCCTASKGKQRSISFQVSHLVIHAKNNNDSVFSFSHTACSQNTNLRRF